MIHKRLWIIQEFYSTLIRWWGLTGYWMISGCAGNLQTETEKMKGMNDLHTDTHPDRQGEDTQLYLKALYTFGNCQRPVFSLCVSHHKHKITSLWKLESICYRSCKKMIKEKTPLLYEFVCFQLGKKRLLSWREITSFSKTTSLQRESFPTMLYTINSSPMLVTKSV